MPLTRRQRRLALASAILAVATFAWLLSRPPADSWKFFSYLHQHPRLCQVVRWGFVLVGKEDEFDTQILFVTVPDLIIGDDEGLMNVDTFIWPEDLQPPPPPVAVGL
ncbi:hypothetical protein AYO47_05170 [Planctomyces sp. SCGC AG-212-M04]|nr:hypothetical protein AYO47_05170 [Planctomyces sp. SCGC AG-212-M04]